MTKRRCHRVDENCAGILLDTVKQTCLIVLLGRSQQYAVSACAIPVGTGGPRVGTGLLGETGSPCA